LVAAWIGRARTARTLEIARRNLNTQDYGRGYWRGDGIGVSVPLPANPRQFRYFDISRQAVGGGTGHSTDSVLRGPTDSLSASSP
jgi:hypothetical protein